MHAEESFDSFYLSTRRQVLHQAFALTGDLSAAQSAVRDAYVAAWHHWRKVSRVEDRTAWVRPVAWNHAQRRHAGRIWHRNKGMSVEHLAVLDGLSKLSGPQRRMLLLVQLAAVPLPQAARELGITQHLAEQHLQAATAALAVHLEADSASLRLRLLDLDGALGDAVLPRASIIRRAGRKRRQAHTVGAAVGALALAVVSGAAVHQPAATEATAATPPAGAAASAGAGTGPSGAPDAAAGQPVEEMLPTAENMLDQDQISRLGTDRPWRVVATHGNTSGDGINTVCQQSRFADPDGAAAIVRTFEARGGRRSAVQTVEVSKSAAQAADAFDTTLGWYSGCRVARLQLLDSYRVDNIGSEASVLMMRVWDRPVTTYSVAIARIGDVTTSTVGRYVGVSPAPPGQITQSLADSVAMLCGRSEATDCAKRPEYTVVPPPPSGEEKGLLAVADLPPVGSIERPWVGTEATRARPNPSRTTCDRADFAAAGARRTRTRTFLIPQAKLPTRFGLSETYGEFGSPRKARAFLDQVRRSVAGCEDRDLATSVTDATSRGGRTPWSMWRLTTEVSEKESIGFRVGFVAVGSTVAQLTFAPSTGADMTGKQFESLLGRAGDRLRELG
ncbi:hypothetical protein [Nocardioides mesophilus]|uniref:RNA polymerase sigma factor 70 region 4 type 2 domain-containing protein n=1 Tax=Nocardioides mesophilus TaxID=433659 RepID=A0A7G9RDR2_9ACTN|nr:hypothetical protein [Nocardioides mesophilus]QNN53737.1 hypothetical protein H9L09_04800 [Nocardioides mesophilus]